MSSVDPEPGEDATEVTIEYGKGFPSASSSASAGVHLEAVFPADISKLPAVVDEVETAPPPATSPRQVVAGPHQDAVFPSLPAPGSNAAPAVEARPRTVVAFPFIRNVFTLARVPWGMSRAGFLEAALAPRGEAVDFDQPERERVRGIASEFLRNHVRRLEHGFYLKTPSHHLAVGTILVSENQVPRTRLRHATFQWAINDGKVVQLKNVRLPVGHLGRYEPPDSGDFGHACHGDDNDLAYFLAVLLDTLGVDAPYPVAAIGAIVTHTNSVATEYEIEPFLEAAAEDKMHELVLPRGDGRVNGEHQHLRYWAVRDTNEAAFSALTAVSGEVVVPNLVRRAFTKQAYAWLSLGFLFLSAMIGQFAGSLPLWRHPPVTLLRCLLAAFVITFSGTFVLAHRFWRLDR